MPAKTIKVAVSLPLEQYRQVEKTRKQLRVSRSSVVSQALKFWSAAGEEAEKVRSYVEGYRRCPESARDLKAFESMAVGVLALEEWKE